MEDHEDTPEWEPFEDVLAHIIYNCWTKTVTVKSDFARIMAAEIAAAASEGLITTKVGGNIYVSQWVPTPAGLEFYQDRKGELIF